MPAVYGTKMKCTWQKGTMVQFCSNNVQIYREESALNLILFEVRLFQCAPNIKQQLWHHQAVDGGGINIQQTFCNALWFPVKWVESQVPFDNRVSKFCGVNCQNIPLVYVFVAFVE